MKWEVFESSSFSTHTALVSSISAHSFMLRLESFEAVFGVHATAVALRRSYSAKSAQHRSKRADVLQMLDERVSVRILSIACTRNFRVPQQVVVILGHVAVRPATEIAVEVVIAECAGKKN